MTFWTTKAGDGAGVWPVRPFAVTRRPEIPTFALGLFQASQDRLEDPNQALHDPFRRLMGAALVDQPCEQPGATKKRPAVFSKQPQQHRPAGLGDCLSQFHSLDVHHNQWRSSLALAETCTLEHGSNPLGRVRRDRETLGRDEHRSEPKLFVRCKPRR